VLARDGLVFDDDVARVHASDHDARLMGQRNGTHARRGADDESRLPRAVTDRLDVGRLVELRSARHLPVLVCAARPASFFLPSETEG
jgi:hypothetical protein